MTPTHPPSLAQIELLALLMEECAEVQQIAAKILRHGWRNDGHCNRIALEHELGDLKWVLALLVREDLVDPRSVARFEADKPGNAAPWLRHNLP